MRSDRMDNIRCLLIFLVVFGHFLALIPGTDGLYRVICLFHMPAFLFLTGYYSRFQFSKILTGPAYPYVLFQILYLLFDTLVLQGGPVGKVRLQFTVPYWLLWSLLDLIFYRLLIPLFDKVPRPPHPLPAGVHRGLGGAAVAEVCPITEQKPGAQPGFRPSLRKKVRVSPPAALTKGTGAVIIFTTPNHYTSKV